ncbi:L-lactate dehydrogenase [Luteococcus sp. H138]|uniref:L-lactate dehydrogenase n=1 Tax=unclassified Luteococcus TaxID=2639923 RepID=UPI00313AD70A
MAKSTRHPSKLSIVGAGAVGTSLAYAALIRGSASVVSLYDIATKKVEAEVKDLAHGTQFTNSTVMGGDDISVVKDSSVVVITAGAKQKPGQTRLDLAATNAKILEQMMPQLLEQAPEALYVLVTNPCDVLTVVAQKISGLPTAQVFSTGTMLDTSRLRYLIAQKTKVAQRNVHATIVGEHGDSEFPVWSSANISSVPIREWSFAGKKVFTDDVLEALAHEAAFAAYEVIEGKGATNYAIGLAGARLVEALLSPTRTALPLSSVLQGYYGIHDVALSLPTLVSSAGIERVLEIPMDPTEVSALHRSAEQLRSSLATLGY